VPIYHGAATADGPVLVMGYLPGGDAERRWLPCGGPVGEVVSCLIDATWGVHHLHNAGLLHRDLKPANLLFDGEGRGVIGDFGLAGVVGGTVPAGYLPHVPASVLNGQPWKRADDIYALAVTGWRLLGAPPMPDDIDVLEAALRAGTWPNRSAWPQHIHARLRRALRSGMHPNVDKRPSSAGAFREALHAAVPVVSWRMASPTEWQGVDSDSTYLLRVETTRSGWRVETLRDRGAGFRRLTNASVDVTTEELAKKAAGATLDVMAAKGVLAVK